MKHLLRTSHSIFLTLALLFLTSATAQADRDHNPEFRKLVRIIEQNPDAVTTTTLYDFVARIEDITPEELVAFEDIAKDQAQVWADTILEGDYQADGDTVLDSVEKLEFNGQLLGYRIFYSEGAWETANCDYQGVPESLKGCTEGRIQEGSIVSKEKDSWARDSNYYAEFHD